MNGFVNVLKPVGATASDVVVCVKHIFREKAGHLGTLDPGASGVLPIAVGQGTRLFDLLTNKVKYYRAFFTFGRTTDTLDSYGEVTDKCDALPDTETLQSVLSQFVGKLQQIPPQYSAISVGGVRSYKLARSGYEVELKPRDIEVFSIELIARRSANTYVLDIKCSGGTYIRSLARDVATACGTVGYMSGLIRLASGCFDISDAYTLDEVRELKEKCLTDIFYPIGELKTLVVSDNLFVKLENGRKVCVGAFADLRKIYCKGVFFGLGSAPKGVLKLDYYLKNAL